jgi:hypothetical protein
MSRLTRDQQFKNDFDNFMKSFCDTYYPETDNWLLMNNTLNKNKSNQLYTLEIPKKKILLYSIDSYVDSNGVRQPKEKVEVDQEIPDIEHFKNYFNGYYSVYVLKTERKLLSYVCIADISIEEFMLKANIIVCYYKNYLPYPSNYQTLEYFKQQNKHLIDENYKLNELLVHSRRVIEYRRDSNTKLRILLGRERQNFNDKLHEIINKMQLKIRDIYSKDDNKEDCPVCYEKINGQELMVPGCCHYICQNCHSKCENCPICREKYIK